MVGRNGRPAGAWGVARCGRDGADARQPLDDNVVAAGVAIWALRAERDVLKVDKARIQLRERRVVQPVTLDIRWLESDENHVGLADKLLDDRPAVRVCDIQADAALATVEYCEALAFAGEDR